MNSDKKRLEQARKEYDEFLSKLFALKLPERLSVEAQWDLSITMLALKKTLNPEFNEKKTLAAVFKRKGKK